MPSRRTTPGPQAPGAGWQSPKLPFRFMPREVPELLHFEKGMDQSQEATVLPNGLLVDCLNWIPEPLGGLRCKIGWTPYTITVNAASLTNALGQTSAGFPATRKIRGIFYCSGLSHADATQFPSGAIYLIGLTNPSNSDRLEFWAVDSGLGAANLNFVQWYVVPTLTDIDFSPPAFAKGISSVLYSHYRDATGANPGITQWAGGIAASPNTLANSPPVRAMAWHANRMFAGGTDPANDTNWVPYALYYSDAGKVTGWAGNGVNPIPGTNWIFVGADDNEPIEDMVPFQGQLIIAKASSVWILTGVDATTFALVKLDGCYGGRGRMLVPTPSGLVILGSDRAWLWNGGDPKVISDGIQAYYNENAGDWRNGFYAGGNVYVTGHTSKKTLVFDISQQAWYAENISVGATSDEMDALSGHNDVLVGGPLSSTSFALASRTIIAGGTRSADTILSPASIFHMKTPDYWLATSREKFTIRHVWIKLRQRSGDHTSNGLVVTPILDGVAQADLRTIAARDTLGVFNHRIDLGKPYTCFSIGLQIDVTPSATPALFDIEEVYPDVLPLPERRGGA